MVSLGMVALAGLAPDPAHPFLSLLLRLCYRLMTSLYGFQGLYRFRDKLRPTRW